jgi:hypothetical protein
MVQILIIGNGFTGREDECCCLLSIASEISILKRLVLLVASLALPTVACLQDRQKNTISLWKFASDAILPSASILHLGSIYNGREEATADTNVVASDDAIKQKKGAKTFGIGAIGIIMGADAKTDAIAIALNSRKDISCSQNTHCPHIIVL